MSQAKKIVAELDRREAEATLPRRDPEVIKAEIQTLRATFLALWKRRDDLFTRRLEAIEHRDAMKVGLKKAMGQNAALAESLSGLLPQVPPDDPELHEELHRVITLLGVLEKELEKAVGRQGYDIEALKAKYLNKPSPAAAT